MGKNELKNGQYHHEKLKFDVGLTCLVFFFKRNPECCAFLPETLVTLSLGAKAAQ